MPNFDYPSFFERNGAPDYTLADFLDRMYALYALLRDKEHKTVQEKFVAEKLDECTRSLSDTTADFGNCPHNNYTEVFEGLWTDFNKAFTDYVENPEYRDDPLMPRLKTLYEQVQEKSYLKDSLIDAMKLAEDFQKDFQQNPEKNIQESNALYARIGAEGTRPTMDESLNMIPGADNLEAYFSRLLWLESQMFLANIASDVDPDRNHYGIMAKQMTERLCSAPLDVQMKFNKMSAQYGVAARAKLYDKYRELEEKYSGEDDEQRKESVYREIRKEPAYQNVQAVNYLQTSAGAMNTLGILNRYMIRVEGIALKNIPGYQQMGLLATGEIESYYNKKLKKLKEDPANSAKLIELDREQKAEKQEINIAYTDQLWKNDFYAESTTAKLFGVYEQIKADTRAPDDLFRPVQNAMEELSKMVPGSGKYQEQLGTLHMAAMDYTRHAGPNTDPQRLKMAKSIESAVNGEADVSRDNIEKWYESFRATAAKDYDLDLNSNADRGRVNWYIDNPKYAEGEDAPRFLPIPAFVSHENDKMRETVFKEKLTALHEHKAQMIAENMFPDGQDITIEDKVNLFRMAKEGRLFITKPGETALHQVRVKIDFSAGIMKELTEVPTEELHGNARRPEIPEHLPHPQEPDFGPEPVIPEPVNPPFALGWKRFANAFTFGRAYQNELQQYTAALENRAVQEARHAEWKDRHDEYEKQLNEYQIRENLIAANTDLLKDYTPMNKELQQLQREYADNDKLSAMLGNINGDMTEQMFNYAADEKISPQLNAVTNSLTGDIGRRMDTLNSAKTYKNMLENAEFWSQKHAEKVDQKAKENGTFDPHKSAGMYRKAHTDAMAIMDALGSSDPADLYKTVYPDLAKANLKSITDKERQYLVNAAIIKASVLEQAGKGQSDDLSADDMKVLAQAQIMSDAIAGNPALRKSIEKNGMPEIHIEGRKVTGDEAFSLMEPLKEVRALESNFDLERAKAARLENAKSKLDRAVSTLQQIEIATTKPMEYARSMLGPEPYQHPELLNVGVYKEGQFTPEKLDYSDLGFTDDQITLINIAEISGTDPRHFAGTKWDNPGYNDDHYANTMQEFGLMNTTCELRANLGELVGRYPDVRKSAREKMQQYKEGNKEPLGKMLGNHVKTFLHGVHSRNEMNERVLGLMDFTAGITDMLSKDPQLMKASGLTPEDMEMLNAYRTYGVLMENSEKAKRMLYSEATGEKTLTDQERDQCLTDVMTFQIMESERANALQVMDEKDPEIMQCKSTMLQFFHDAATVKAQLAQLKGDKEATPDMLEAVEFTVKELDKKSELEQSKMMVVMGNRPMDKLMELFRETGSLDKGRQLLSNLLHKEPTFQELLSKPIDEMCQIMSEKKTVDPIQERVNAQLNPLAEKSKTVEASKAALVSPPMTKDESLTAISVMNDVLTNRQITSEQEAWMAGHTEIMQFVVRVGKEEFDKMYAGNQRNADFDLCMGMFDLILDKCRELADARDMHIASKPVHRMNESEKADTNEINRMDTHKDITDKVRKEFTARGQETRTASASQNKNTGENVKTRKKVL